MWPTRPPGSAHAAGNSSADSARPVKRPRVELEVPSGFKSDDDASTHNAHVALVATLLGVAAQQLTHRLDGRHSLISLKLASDRHIYVPLSRLLRAWQAVDVHGYRMRIGTVADALCLSIKPIARSSTTCPSSKRPKPAAGIVEKTAASNWRTGVAQATTAIWTALVGRASDAREVSRVDGHPRDAEDAAGEDESPRARLTAFACDVRALCDNACDRSAFDVVVVDGRRHEHPSPTDVSSSSIDTVPNSILAKQVPGSAVDVGEMIRVCNAHGVGDMMLTNDDSRLQQSGRLCSKALSMASNRGLISLLWMASLRPPA